MSPDMYSLMDNALDAFSLNVVKCNCFQPQLQKQMCVIYSTIEKF